jgi:hypothetical protein
MCLVNLVTLVSLISLVCVFSEFILGKSSLPSGVAFALGKEASFAECLLVHSTKELTKGVHG